MHEDDGAPLPVIRRAPGEPATPDNTPAPAFDPPDTPAAPKIPLKPAADKAPAADA